MTAAADAGVRRSIAPQASLLAMIAIWGASFVAIKEGVEAWPPFAFLSLRFWLALACLLPFLPRCGGWPALRRSMRPGLVTGLALFVGYSCQTVGMTGTTAAKAGFIIGLIVVLVPVGAFLFHGERLRSNALLGLLLGLVGVGLLCLEGDLRPQQGDLLQIAAAVAYAGHILLITRLSPRGATVAFCTWQVVAVAVAGSVCCALLELPSGLPPTTGTLWAALLYTATLATALGIAVQSRVQPMIPSAQVALLFATQPLFAALAAWILRGETMDLQKWIGGLTIVAGIVIASRRPSRTMPGQR
jgi:drug/metabolite transporter (DMT)-like permease